MLFCNNSLNNEVHFEHLFRTNETRSRKISVSTDIRIVYVRDGKAVWKIGEAVYNVKAGCILLLSSTVSRMIVEIDPPCPLEFMVLAFDNRIYFSQLSEMANMNAGAFSRYFKKCNGITVCRYIRNKRIARAIDLLESTNSGRTLRNIFYNRTGQSKNRVGGCPLVGQPSSHTTVRTVRYTAVQ
jgi:AraC-like DNA-binding protein